jgi:hypothetical protein
MYYTGLNPLTLQPVHVPKGQEKKIQRALLQYRDPRNRAFVVEGLKSAGRTDLIGTGRASLVCPEDRLRRQFMTKCREMKK